MSGENNTNRSFALQNFSEDDFAELQALLSGDTSIDSRAFDHATFAVVKKKIIPTAAPSSTDDYKQLSFTMDEVNALTVFLAARQKKVLRAKILLEEIVGTILYRKKEFKDLCGDYASKFPRCSVLSFFKSIQDALDGSTASGTTPKIIDYGPVLQAINEAEKGSYDLNTENLKRIKFCMGELKEMICVYHALKNGGSTTRAAIFDKVSRSTTLDWGSGAASSGAGGPSASGSPSCSK